MKLIHLSDLHLGKRISEFSMLDEQDYILLKILNIIDNERPDGVILAGDIYDKSVPSAEAVKLFDKFLYQLAKRKLQVFVISGNHDSPERIAFGSRIMDASGIHMSPVYNGEIEPVTLEDQHGEVNVYMLPFVKPANVRGFYEETEITSYTDAMRCIIGSMDVDTSKRNVLITHQFVTGATRSESEERSVGGTDNVDASVFGAFDYVALGHLHSPQNCGSERIRYCGTPLKYSFAEAKDQKSVTVVELGCKGDMHYRTVDLVPLHDMVNLRGNFNDLMQRSFYEGTTWQDDYIRIILTDEDDIPDAMARLRVIYKNLISLDYDNKRTSYDMNIEGDENVEKKSPYELFTEFYEMQNNQPVSEEQSKYLKDVIEKIWEDEA